MYCKLLLDKNTFFCLLVFSCQVLDGWRIAEVRPSKFKLYKTEASWALLSLLIIFIRSLSNLFSLKILENFFFAKNNKKILFIHITIGYCLFAFIETYRVLPSKRLKLKLPLREFQN